MNDDKTTKEQADKLAADLNVAGAKLEAAEIPAPTIPEDAKATVMGVTSTEATVSWTKLPRAESYKVYAVEHAGTAKALKAIYRYCSGKCRRTCNNSRNNGTVYESETGYILCIYDRRSKPQ